MILRRLHQRSPLPTQENENVSNRSKSKTNRHRPWYKRPLFLSVIALLLLRIIDFQAILERPDPIDHHDINALQLSKKTLIIMIETRPGDRDKTACINRNYAARHNYDFVVVSHHWCFDKYRNRFGKLAYLWCRPLIFKHYLQTYSSIFYVDSDAYFCNPTMSIEAFLDYARKQDFFILNSGTTTFCGAEDCGEYLTNGGIQYWKKTQYTNRMLTTWFLLYRRQFIYYWLRIHWLPNYEIHYFMNREQGSYKVAVEENDWIKQETSIIRYGKKTWHLPYADRECILRPKWESTFFLNHIVVNFGSMARKRAIQEHLEKHNISCPAQ